MWSLDNTYLTHHTTLTQPQPITPPHASTIPHHDPHHAHDLTTVTAMTACVPMSDIQASSSTTANVLMGTSTGAVWRWKVQLAGSYRNSSNGTVQYLQQQQQHPCEHMFTDKTNAAIISIHACKARILTATQHGWTLWRPTSRGPWAPLVWDHSHAGLLAGVMADARCTSMMLLGRDGIQYVCLVCHMYHDHICAS